MWCMKVPGAQAGGGRGGGGGGSSSSRRLAPEFVFASCLGLHVQIKRLGWCERRSSAASQRWL